MRPAPAEVAAPADGTAGPAGFPRVYAAAKWVVIGSLVLLALLAAAFWTLVLGGFAASGFRAQGQGASADAVAITPECAWPYGVTDANAAAMCRMFNKLTPEQRAAVLRSRH